MPRGTIESKSLQDGRESRIAHGTYFFACVTDDFVAAAIDSRENRGAKHHDGVCKVSILDDFTIFLHQGIARGESFDSTTVARHCFSEQKKPVNLYKLACSWAEEMSKHVKSLCTSDPAIIKDMKPDAAGAMFIAHDSMGPVSGIQVRIQELKGHVLNLIDSVPAWTTVYTSHREIVDEVLACSSSRAKALFGSIEPTGIQATDWALRSKMCVQAVIDWTEDEEVGGEIAAVILERGKKYRWFQRPTFCPEK